MTSALTLRSVSRHFGETRAVDNVSLSIEAGQFVGVIGRSGAGKSTLLRLINRLIDPSAGSDGATPAPDALRVLGRSEHRGAVRTHAAFL